MEKYFRHYIQQKVSHKSEWQEPHWEFSQDDADTLISKKEEGQQEWIKEKNEKHEDIYATLSWRPRITHEITKEDFDQQKKWTIPLNQYIYQI